MSDKSSSLVNRRDFAYSVSSGALLATDKHLGSSLQVIPRRPGCWPGYRFTSPPLSLPAGGFGMGYGRGAHAPDEYLLTDSEKAGLQGLDGAVASYVEFLYSVA